MLRHMPTLKGTPADSPTGKHPQDFTTYRVLAWKIHGQRSHPCLINIQSEVGAWWAAVYGVAQSWTRLKLLSSSSSSSNLKEKALTQQIQGFSPIRSLRGPDSP